MGITPPPGIKRNATSTDANVPRWSGTSGDTLADGLAVGTAANNLVQLDGSAKLPAVDGSQLTGITAGQSPFECVVATSGGDYTSIATAIAAGKRRIFVKNGTYNSEGVNAEQTARLNIVGESREGVIINLSYPLNGTTVTADIGSSYYANMTLSGAVANITLSGGTIANQIKSPTFITNCSLTITGSVSTQVIRSPSTGTAALLSNCVLTGNSSGATASFISVGDLKCYDCVFVGTQSTRMTAGTSGGSVHLENCEWVSTVTYPASAFSFGARFINCAFNGGSLSLGSGDANYTYMLSNCGGNTSAETPTTDFSINAGQMGRFILANCRWRNFTGIAGVSVKMTGCEFTGTVAAAGPTSISNCEIGGTLTISGSTTRVDNSMLAAVSISANTDDVCMTSNYCSSTNTITVAASTCDRTILIGNNTGAAISDSGTNTEIAHNVQH